MNARPAFLLTCLLISAISCSPPAHELAGESDTILRWTGSAPADVVLITVDTLRADATGFSGSGLVRTPNLDRLATSGVVFSNAHAHEVITLPSHASMLTGLYPHHHGVRDNAGYRLGTGIPTLAETLRKAGFRTGAFVSAFTLDRRYGLDRGFEVYDDHYEGRAAHGFSPPERPGRETVDVALAWWESHAGERRFLWLHLFTPHFPYQPESPFDEEYADRPYYGEAATADRELAPLLDRFRAQAEPPLIVFTSDHGESLGEHGEATHGVFAYESTLHIPLVIASPGNLAPGTFDGSARHVDLLPTILAALELPPPERVDGRNLAAPPPAGHDRGSYFESLSPFFNRGWAPLFGRIEGNWKTIDLPIPELYDLTADATETTNLALREVDRWKAGRARLPAERRDVEPPGRVDAEAIRRLRSLGYLSGGGEPPADPFDEANDPKSLIALDSLLDDALAAAHRGEPRQAETSLRQLIGKRPTMSVAYGHLYYLLSDRGAWEEAAAILRQAITAGAGNESIHRKLALARIKRGDIKEAEAVLQPFNDSLDPETQSAWGRLEAGRKRFLQAETRFERALQIDPSYPGARTDRGILTLMKGDAAGAIEQLEASLALDPFQAEAWNALGAAHATLRDFAEAAEAWERALEADPQLADACFNLAGALEATGNPTRAADMWGRYAKLVDGAERTRALDRRDLLRGVRSP